MAIELGSGFINPESGFRSNRTKSIHLSSNPSSGDLVYSILLLLPLLLPRLQSMNAQSAQRQSAQRQSAQHVLLVRHAQHVQHVQHAQHALSLSAQHRNVQLVLFVKNAFVRKFIVIPATALFVKTPPSSMPTSLT